MGWKQELWPEWQIECDIGAGAYGTVYKIKREDIGGIYYAALKVISVPRDRRELDMLYKKNMSDKEVSEYYYRMALEITKEFAFMEKLKGHTNIVSYEDHKIVSHKHGVGWDVLIRMELLKSLPEYLETKKFDEKEVCKLGIDICNALILCEKEQIIHRDVKPGNIFVSDYGDYKLGDFSLAKHIELCLESSSPQGTYAYMAPEVYKNQRYDFTIDIYSLGLILYRLLNRGRGPFQPLPPKIISTDISENANQKRLYAETLPKPIDASPMMSSIILKACAYNAEKRYKNASEMQKALVRCASSQIAINATKQISYYLKRAAFGLQDSYEENVSTNVGYPDKEGAVDLYDKNKYNRDNVRESQNIEKSSREIMRDFFTKPGDL